MYKLFHNKILYYFASDDAQFATLIHEPKDGYDLQLCSDRPSPYYVLVPDLYATLIKKEYPNV